MYAYERKLDGEWQLFIAEHKHYAHIADHLRDFGGLRSMGLTSIPGRVPGNFELDMERAGLIPDLFYGENILIAQDLENRHLWYRTVFIFDGDPSLPTYLTFEGVDTVADYYVNGAKVGSSDNMLVEHTFEICARVGQNELLVHIRPSVLEARKRPFEAGVLSFMTTNGAGVSLRKPPHCFGWDIMPRLVSGGIWKSVYLRQKKPNRIESCFLIPTAVEPRGCFHLYCLTELAEDETRRYSLSVHGQCGESRFAWEQRLFHNEIQHDIWFDDPILWWPNGMGEPNLYDVTVELLLDGEAVDSSSFRSGLRTVELVNSETVEIDGSGAFYFKVNGRRFYARGTNWVPLDAFHSRDTENLPRALSLLSDCHCNMVRNWGGSVYESDTFYDYCDEHGIAVWQDFAMACSFYPQTPEFCDELRREAEKTVRRLRRHTSLFVWAGDNENDFVIDRCHSGPSLDPNQNILTRKVLPEVLRRLDPYRLYLPSSPYLSPRAYAEKKATPEYHPWGPRGYLKDDYYLNNTDYFISEIGYHGCPSPISIPKFISPERLWPNKDNPEWILHASNMTADPNGEFAYRIPLMASQIQYQFGTVPDTLNEFALLSQITQAEADKFFIESNRLRKWHHAGGIFFWNMIDGWPQFSDAVVDYYGEKKIAYYVIRRSFEPIALFCREPSQGRIELAGANDSLSDASISYRVENLTDGSLLAEGETVLHADLTENVVAFDCPTLPQAVLGITWQTGNREFRSHYLYGKAPFDKAVVLDGYRKLGLLDFFRT